MQRPPLFESDSFIYWKNRFESYVKSKDLDLWHVITNDDFQPIIQNPKTKLDEVVPFEKQSDELKRWIAKNNEAKMVIYSALPRKEYERIFMCNTEKDIWKTLLITHQGNNQVKDNKIDLLVQQYEQFVISKEESIDNAFARFNTIITSLKALDEGTDKSKITRKQSKSSKHGHENQKSTKAGSKARKVKPQSNPRITSPNPPIGQSPSKKATSTMVKAQINVGFCTKILTKEAQTSHQWNDTLAILRCPQSDLTAQNLAPMIDGLDGRD
ncbi:hypothetical protein Tco_0949065 [Tanacetum coccineum]